MVQDDRDAGAQLVFHERTADRAGRGEPAPVPESELRLAAEFVRRPRGDEIDRPAEAVAAVHGRLGTLDHFDAFQIELTEIQAFATGDIYAVNENRRIVLPVLDRCRRNASNYGHREKLADQVREGHAGRKVRHVVQILDPRRLDFRGAEGGNRKRHILQPLLHPACGHHDLFEGDRALLSVCRSKKT